MDLVKITELKPGDSIELGGVRVLLELIRTLPTGDFELWYSNKAPNGDYRAGIVIFVSTAHVWKFDD